jgi:hypothetical protein
MQMMMQQQQQQMMMQQQRMRASSDPRMMGIRSVSGSTADAALAGAAATGGMAPSGPSSGFGFIQPTASSPQQAVQQTTTAPDSFNFVSDALASARGN